MHSNLSSHPTANLSEDEWRAGGKYIRLSEGITHWRREGPESGIPLVLVHGATVPCWEFDCLAPPTQLGSVS